MNNFSGIMSEYGDISVDNFESVNCLAYFLSHCHTDHMKGLDGDAFFNRLANSGGRIKLYCSTVTKDLLKFDKNNFCHSRLSDYTCSLEVNEPTSITLHYDDDGNASTCEGSKIVVTLLEAKHCLGSVMFLFEGCAGTVLYTGDFRLTRKHLKRMSHLHSEHGTVKRIKKLYLDTTFCLPQCLTFPTRKESRDELFCILDKWFANRAHTTEPTPADNAAYVNGNAQYGYEYIFVQLMKKYNKKIHVCQSKLDKYQNVPELYNAVTSVATQTHLHACFYKSDNGWWHNGSRGVLPCERNERLKFLYVKLSTMWFVDNYDKVGKAISYEESPLSQRVLYSMHSSYGELLDLVRYLKPVDIHPIVVPKDSSVERLLAQLTNCRNVDELRSSYDSDSPPMEARRSFGSLDDGLVNSENVGPESQLIFVDGDESGSEAEPESDQKSEPEPDWKLTLSPNNSSDGEPTSPVDHKSGTDSSEEADEQNATLIEKVENKSKLIERRRLSSDKDDHASNLNNVLAIATPEEVHRKYLQPLVDSPKRSKVTKKRILEPTSKPTSMSSKRSSDSSDEKTSRRLKLTSPKKAGKTRATVRGKKEENKFRLLESPPESEAEAEADDDDEAEAEQPVSAKYKRSG